MTTGSNRAADALQLARRSPEVVLARDRARWLALFAPDAVLEDPVGAGAYRGSDVLASFWDVFIAPQRSIRFLPRREIASPERAIRVVTISTLTPASETPFEIPAIVEYRARAGLLSQLRAFWEPRRAVVWHGQQGLRGIRQLMSHGIRSATGLGVRSSIGFARALRPAVSTGRKPALCAALHRAVSDRSAWFSLCSALEIRSEASDGTTEREPEIVWERHIAPAQGLQLEEAIAAGNYLACILAGPASLVAALCRMRGRTIQKVELLWADPALNE